MAKHKPRKSAPTEYTNDDEDMLMYDVEEELEPDPTDKFVSKECPSNFPKGYLRSLTPTQFRKRSCDTEEPCRGNSLWKNRERRRKKTEGCTTAREFKQEYHQLGHIQAATVENDISKMKYFLPHHGVYRPEKSTTKLRVFFNASSPTDNGSLNDIPFNGGVIQDDLYAQMVIFPTFRYALTADIKKMYRMILFDSEQG
ncbi:DUF1758 domain-containing protein [Trichonephila clavipes]|nr:DUF1758 domain-containing protein [Trichonephila clavipes]